MTSATGVSVTLQSGTGNLTQPLTGTIQAGSSEVTLSSVTYSKAENGVILGATRTSGDNLTTGDSAPFVVVAGGATKLGFVTQPGNTSAGNALPGPPVVAVQDDLGNTVPSSTAQITVAIGSNPGGGTLTGNAPNGKVTVQLLNPDGSVLATFANTVNDGWLETVTLPVNGIYTLFVNAINESTGTGTVQLQYSP